MPYTLGMTLLWPILALIIGGIIGWLLHNLTCTGKSSTTVSSSESEELTRLRGRVANLEPIVTERDRLKAQLSETEGDLRACLAAKVSRDANPVPVAAFAGIRQEDHDVVLVDRDRLSNLVGAHESTIGDLRGQLVGLKASLDAKPQGFAAFAGGLGAADLENARRVFGKAIKMDDLKIVEGIGPVLEGVFNNAGIETWTQLAEESPDRLREILVSADERHRIHNPTTWPRQSRLAALGEFEALKAWQDALDAGKQ